MAIKDRDSQEIALYLRALPYAIILAGLTFAPAMLLGTSFLRAVLYALIAFAIGLFVPVVFSERTAAAAASIYHSSGKSTPPVRQYSLADSLVARGRNDEAAEAYILLSEDYADDPEPRVRLARLLRDKMARYVDAAEWFKRALTVPQLEPSIEVAILRELIEIYTHKLNTPERALPHLVRLYDKHPAHPAAEWARNEYADIKHQMQADRTDD